MNFFEIPVNIFLAQAIGGAFTGICIGILAPSNYERSLSFEQRQAVWKWKKYSPLTLISFLTLIVKICLMIALIMYINIAIAKYFNCYPMSKTGVPLYIFGIFFFIFAPLSKYIRYQYFKWYLQKKI